jgi:2-polyprenyl-3-methyl-5-hydroxy-6-metoxy-1,4-benzoquinol methylase
VRNGIPILLKKEIYWGFTSREKARTLNALAAREGWQAAAQEYARTEHPGRYDYYYEYIASEARADFSILAKLTPESRVLDIGSGWGNLATGMARVVGEVYALDSTYENLEFVAIRAAQEGLDNVHPVGASATCLPFPDEFFDLIVMNGVLEWVGTADHSASPLDLQRQALRQA